MLSYKNKPSIDDFINKYGSIHPLLHRFEATEQDAVFHAEGNVKIHTNLVLKHTYEFIESNEVSSQLSESELTVLMFAAAYHDYAKPITTKEDMRNGRLCILAPGHEFVGASLLLNSEKPEELTSHEWLSVIKLVAYHQMPKKLISQDASHGEYVKLLRHCGDMRLIYGLEVADFKGRACEDIEDELVYLEIFKEICKDYDVFCSYENYHLKHIHPIELEVGIAATYRGLSDFSNGKIHDLSMIKHMNYSHEKRPMVYVMCGLAGSGKSTYINKNLSHAVVVSLDEIRKEVTGNASNQSLNNEVVRIAMDRVRDHLRNGVDIVYDATSIRTDFRTLVTNLCHSYGYASQIIVMPSTVKQCMKNISKRDRKVEQEIIQNQFNSFQIPHLNEAEQVLFILA